MIWLHSQPDKRTARASWFGLPCAQPPGDSRPCGCDLSDPDLQSPKWGIAFVPRAPYGQTHPMSEN